MSWDQVRLTSILPIIIPILGIIGNHLSSNISSKLIHAKEICGTKIISEVTKPVKDLLYKIKEEVERLFLIYQTHEAVDTIEELDFEINKIPIELSTLKEVQQAIKYTWNIEFALQCFKYFRWFFAYLLSFGIIGFLIELISPDIIPGFIFIILACTGGVLGILIAFHWAQTRNLVQKLGEEYGISI